VIDEGIRGGEQRAARGTRERGGRLDETRQIQLRTNGEQISFGTHEVAVDLVPIEGDHALASGPCGAASALTGRTARSRRA